METCTAAASGGGSSTPVVPPSATLADYKAPVTAASPPLLRMLCHGNARATLFNFMTTADAAALRAVCARAAADVAEHPWGDNDKPLVPCQHILMLRLWRFKFQCMFKHLEPDWFSNVLQQKPPASVLSTPVVRHGLSGWRASFPRARRVKLVWDDKAELNQQMYLCFGARAACIVMSPVRLEMGAAYDHRVEADAYMICLYAEVDMEVLPPIETLVDVKAARGACMPLRADSIDILLRRMTFLETLTLNRCGFDMRFLTECTALRVLRLEHCNYTDMAFLPLLTQLRVLYADSVDGVTDAHLEALVALEEVELLNMRNVAGLSLLKLPQLRKVDIRSQVMQSSTAELLAKMILSRRGTASICTRGVTWLC